MSLYRTTACGLGPDVGETTRPEPGLITPLVEKEMRKQGEEGGDKLPFPCPIPYRARSAMNYSDDAILGQLNPTSAQEF